jgi:hypothetical protein
MGIPISYSYGRKLGLLGLALVLCSLTGSARAEETTPQQNAGAPYSVPIAKLQVTGNAEKFSLDADHADALSVLKAIFNQANAQFTTDSSVVGQVTMRLTGQSFATTLDAVCKQLLIRYQKNAKGIYVFEQDAEAAKATILRLQEQNALLRQQLRAMGLSLPEESVFDSARSGVSGPAGRAGGLPSPTNAAPPGGFGGGGIGKTPENKSTVPDRARDGGRQGSASEPTPRRAAAKADQDLRGNAGGRTDALPNNLTANLNYLTAEDIAEIFAVDAQKNALQNPDNYRAFLQQNGLVYINTGGQKIPVTQVLQELGRQSNTGVILDSSIPTGAKFNLQGYITPRTLPEALNVLTQSTRLTWRWLGARVYVAALPDFQIFFNSTSPRVIFGGSAYPTQQFGGQGQQQLNNNTGYGSPNQTPLPITNGEKKTP